MQFTAWLSLSQPISPMPVLYKKRLNKDSNNNTDVSWSLCFCLYFARHWKKIKKMRINWTFRILLLLVMAAVRDYALSIVPRQGRKSKTQLIILLSRNTPLKSSCIASIFAMKKSPMHVRGELRIVQYLGGGGRRCWKVCELITILSTKRKKKSQSFSFSVKCHKLHFHEWGPA